MTIWTDYVRAWAAKKNLSYGCAISKPEIKIDYKRFKAQNAPPTKKQGKAESKERGSMSSNDVNVYPQEYITPAPKKLTKQNEIIKKNLSKIVDVLSGSMKKLVISMNNITKKSFITNKNKLIEAIRFSMEETLRKQDQVLRSGELHDIYENAYNELRALHNRVNGLNL